MRHPRVIRDDKEKFPATPQSADELRPVAFEHADHGSSGGLWRVRPATLGPHIAAHQHAIFVQRGGRFAFGDGDFLQRRIVGLEKSFALTIHADASGNQIRFAWEDVAVALDAGDATGLFEIPQHALEILLTIRRQAEVAEQFGNVEREVVSRAEQAEKFFCDIFHLRFAVCCIGLDGGKHESLRCVIGNAESLACPKKQPPQLSWRLVKK